MNSDVTMGVSAEIAIRSVMADTISKRWRVMICGSFLTVGMFLEATDNARELTCIN